MEHLVHPLLMHIPDTSSLHEARLGGREGTKVQSFLGNFSCHILLYQRLEDCLPVIRLYSHAGMQVCAPLHRPIGERRRRGCWNVWRPWLTQTWRFWTSDSAWLVIVAILSKVITSATCYVVILARRHMTAAGKTSFWVCLLFAIWHDLAFGYLIEAISLFGI